MSDNKKYEAERRKLWEQKKQMAVDAEICPDCGDQSKSWRECAYAKFKPKINADEKKWDYEEMRQKMWEHRRRTTITTQVRCNKCGGYNSSWCECKYSKYHPTQEQIEDFIFQHE